MDKKNIIGKTLLREENLVSLRTAFVRDDGNLCFFMLMSRSFENPVPQASDPGKSTWLYRTRRSFLAEMELKFCFSPVEQGIKPMTFRSPPGLRLIWTASGQDVALFLNDEPWAFICEERNHGYSKGILRATIGNPWDQSLFEDKFGGEGL